MEPDEHDPFAGVPDVALLTVSEIATTLRISRASVYRLIRSGQLPATRFGDELRITAGAARSLLAQ